MIPEIVVENRITPGAWARDQLTSPSASTLESQDGRLMVVCEHGIGHTAAVTALYYESLDGPDPFLHGCDGCCGGYRGVSG